MSKHTPSPWVQQKDEYDSEPYGWIVGPNGEEVVSYGGCGSHQAYWANPADLALALTAPELLEALLRFVTDAQEVDVGGGDAVVTTCESLDAARAAISKATGSQ